MTDDSPQAFIQWKGTSVCMDVYCECGGSAHVCGETFAYYWQCEGCGQTWEVGYLVPLTKVGPQTSSVVRGQYYSPDDGQ